MEPKYQNSNYRKVDNRDKTLQKSINRGCEEYSRRVLGLQKATYFDEDDLGLSSTGVDIFCSDEKFEWKDLLEVRTLPFLTDWENAHESVVSPVCQYDNQKEVYHDYQ